MLGPQGDRVQAVFVSVDPERDTPEMLKAYMDNFGPGFIAAQRHARADGCRGARVQGVHEGAGQDRGQLHGGPHRGLVSSTQGRCACSPATACRRRTRWRRT